MQVKHVIATRRPVWLYLIAFVAVALVIDLLVRAALLHAGLGSDASLGVGTVAGLGGFALLQAVVSARYDARHYRTIRDDAPSEPPGS